MASRVKHLIESVHVNDEVISGNFTLGTAGAIGAFTAPSKCGVTIVKTATKTGRYTLTFQRKVALIKAATGGYVGNTDSAFPTTTASNVKLRNFGQTSVDLQLTRSDTNADAEGVSGDIITFIIVVSRSK